ncbi:hypothetical protein PVK06_009063 [Gossypium arboreum]|uniref:Uncharacterized protein n=1 Tax=Gossypium arboreum TaxID=29729 RepID=A0ABR0QLN3_GOSAR|nr:hypothetical protein PVK06_009063 [Gossypium arboreum]
MLLINYESWHQMPDSNKNQALDNIKERFALEVSDTYIKKNREQVGTSSRQKQKFTHTTGSKSFACVAEAEDKLKDKKVEYEAIALSDSSVNLEDIDNRIITEVLGPKSVLRKAPLKVTFFSGVLRKAPLKVTFFSGVFEKSASKGHVSRTPLKVMFFSGVSYLNAAKC